MHYEVTTLCVPLAYNLTTTCAIPPLLVSADDKMEASVTECYFLVVRTNTQRCCKSAAAALLHVGLYKMQDKAMLIVDCYFTNSSTTYQTYCDLTARSTGF
jgi:hypothetical protein